MWTTCFDKLKQDSKVMHESKALADLRFFWQLYGWHGETTGAGASWQPVCFRILPVECAFFFNMTNTYK